MVGVVYLHHGYKTTFGIDASRGRTSKTGKGANKNARFSSVARNVQVD
jgi:hypothetical protein